MNTLAPAQALKKTVQNMDKQFAAALPKHIKTEKFVRVVMTAIGLNSKLVEAERNTFFSACMKAAQDGLLPDGKEAAITTYNTKNGVVAQYMPMVAGLRKKARNSGEIAYMTADVIYSNDEFEYYLDHTGIHFTHRPKLFADRGDAIGAYSFAKLKDGEISVEVMNKEQIESVQKMSKGTNTPWNGPFWSEMWKKSVMRRHSKVLPMSSDLEMSLTADDDLYDLPKEEPVEPPAEAPTVPTNLMNTINVSAKKVEEEPAEEKPVEQEQPPADFDPNEEIPI